MNKKFQVFVASIVLYLIMPLVPIGVEAAFTSSITSETTTLTASMYAIAIGLSSRWIGLFAISLLIGMAFALSFGLTVGPGAAPSEEVFWIKYAALGAICFVFIMHASERVGRHLLQEDPESLPFLQL